MKVLQAFYDLKVSPATYDIISFVYLAEMVRLRENLEAMELSIVSNDEGDGYRTTEADAPKSAKDWMLHHVMLQSDVVLPSCRRTNLIVDREEARKLAHAADHTFPEDYSVDAPQPQYILTELLHLGMRGAPCGTFKPTPEALERMESWLLNRVKGRKLVTITLREMARQPGRNSNLQAWTDFARSLDPATYFPVIVRDTMTIFNKLSEAYDGLTICDLASLNMELRTALYELSYVNMFVNNGPGGLLHLTSTSRYIQLKPGGYGENITERYERQAGFGPDYHFIPTTTHQKIILEPDSPANIAKYFDLIVETIEMGEAAPSSAWPTADVWLHRFARYGAFREAERMLQILLSDSPEPDQLNADFNSVVEQYAEVLINEDQIEDAKNGYDLLVRRAPKDIGYGLKRLQTYLMQNDFERSLAELDRLELLGADLESLQLIRGQCFIYVGRHSEAVPYLKNHLAANPSDAIALMNLAEALRATGDQIRPAEILRRALVAASGDDDLTRDIERQLMEAQNDAST